MNSGAVGSPLCARPVTFHKVPRHGGNSRSVAPVVASAGNRTSSPFVHRSQHTLGTAAHSGSGMNSWESPGTVQSERVFSRLSHAIEGRYHALIARSVATSR